MIGRSGVAARNHNSARSPNAPSPLIEVGEFVADRAVPNGWRCVETASISPSNLVPGRHFSQDRMRKRRMFACADARRHRDTVAAARVGRLRREVVAAKSG